ncbi:RDD family protein [Tundrisphaera lichenicola]|uniref:RDD family protein n=1 Tax=Tundrisphaera lichenicola TaxID=2029860 RepID=UPI003EC069FD
MAATVEDDEWEPLDTSVLLVTPERVHFRYPLAGPFRRVIAYLIDLGVILILILLGGLISLVFTLGSAASMGPILAIIFALVWGYGAFCEGMFNGQTLGKRALGIRVMTTQGVPITGSQAVIRNLIGSVDGPMPFVYLPGLASMILTSRFQRLGDLAAGTMVVVEESRLRASVTKVDESLTAEVLAYLPLRVQAGQELARALSDYVRHRGRLGRERREEIARHLALPLRERFGLPESATSDAILCAYYQRVFLGG